MPNKESYQKYKDYYKKYYEINKERLREQHKKYYEANKERIQQQKTYQNMQESQQLAKEFYEKIKDRVGHIYN